MALSESCVTMAPEAAMVIELSEELRQALIAAGNAPATVKDPETEVEYVLIRADAFARMRAIVDGLSKRAGWDDPAMDDYERYRK